MIVNYENFLEADFKKNKIPFLHNDPYLIRGLILKVKEQVEKSGDAEIMKKFERQRAEINRLAETERDEIREKYRTLEGSYPENLQMVINYVDNALRGKLGSKWSQGLSNDFLFRLFNFGKLFLIEKF